MTGQLAWPDWLTVSVPAEGPAPEVDSLLRDLGLHTVCEEARCPNIWDCYHRRTATFLVLGDRCTRACRFCAVAFGRPEPPDPTEPSRLTEAARRLGLDYVILTSVTRDDLADGGAGHIAACIRAAKRALPRVPVEVLVSDFRGDPLAVDTVAGAGPVVFGHNLETAPRLYARVRPGADYGRSLDVLARASAAGLVIKSGLMLGLGETAEEVERVMVDLRAAGCSLLTLGQYLRPTERELPVERYVSPPEFEDLRTLALSLGFSGVAAGPLVRSSYQALELAVSAGAARTPARPEAPAATLHGCQAQDGGPTCHVRDLGRIDYAEFLRIQGELVAARQKGGIGDTLLLAEHDPVLTCGRDGGEDQVLVTPEALREKGIAVVASDRGGSITYHGPGQLMIYPILDLRRFGSDVHLHLWRLEEAIIRTLAGWGVPAARRPGCPGVWVEDARTGPAKIAAVGIAVARGVTSHGAALNLDPDLGAFGLINPCGLRGAAVTSVRTRLERLAGGNPPGRDTAAAPAPVPGREQATTDFCRHFSDVYGLALTSPRSMGDWGTC